MKNKLTRDVSLDAVGGIYCLDDYHTCTTMGIYI